MKDNKIRTTCSSKKKQFLKSVLNISLQSNAFDYGAEWVLPNGVRSSDVATKMVCEDCIPVISGITAVVNAIC